MGRRKKDSITRCFNIDKKIFNLLEYLTEDGFLTLTQAVEKSIKGRFIHEFGQDEYNKIFNKENLNIKNYKKTKKEENNLSEEEKKEELERLKADRKARKVGANND